MPFIYKTEHRANQAICRLFDQGKIESLLAPVVKTDGGFYILTRTEHDNRNVFKD